MKILDISNKIIFFAKALVFMALIFIISSTQDNLVLPSLTIIHIEPNFFMIAVPIIFTAFGFHGCIPMIIKYLEADHKLVKKSFLYGSLLSLLIYSVWVFAINGIIPAQGDESLAQIKKAANPLAQFIITITYFVGYGNFRILIEAFGFLAMVTSLFGVGASLYDYFLDRYFSRIKFSKIYAVILTFLPPILTILINKDIFIQALAFAAIFLSLIAIILPNLINMRINHSTGISFRSIALLTAGGLIILFEIMNLLNGYLEKLF
jgi:tyrosine-specific transport protein